MLPIPYDIDVSSLREHKVTQVCYSTQDITIHFQHGAYITINGYFALRIGRQRHEYYKLSPASGDHGLLCLLDKEVTDVYLNTGRDNMTIEFTGGCRLELKGHHMEDTYTLHIRNREVTV